MSAAFRMSASSCADLIIRQPRTTGDTAGQQLQRIREAFPRGDDEDRVVYAMRLNAASRSDATLQINNRALTQQQLATIAGTSQSAISRALAQQRNASANTTSADR